MKTAIFASLLGLAATASAGSFKEQTIDDKIQIGYGLAIADVNGDGKPDILLVDKAQVVWYESPTWEKHVIAEKLTAIDHVCIAAQDIDGGLGEVGDVVRFTTVGLDIIVVARNGRVLSDPDRGYRIVKSVTEVGIFGSAAIACPPTCIDR